MNNTISAQEGELTRTLSRFIADTRYDRLPEAVSERAKRSILDTMSVILPASVLMPGIKEVVDLVVEAGGKEESTVLGYGVKLPCWSAAFANGIRAHSLDYADGHLEAVFRIGVSVVPPALAIAERMGRVSGKDLIAAVAAAEEILCRLGVAVARRRRDFGPWHCGILLGYFGATASAGKVLGLTAEEIEKAFGIAFLQAGGTVGVASSEANIRGMYAGFVGQTGVNAALMAGKGILGPRDCLGSRYGLFNVYFNGEYDVQALIGGLGKKYEILNLSFKPWPACAFAHPYIDAILGLRKEYALDSENIAEIEVFSGEVNRKLCEPIRAKEGRVPSTTNEGKRSIPFCVAVAAVKGKISFGDFTPDGLRNPEVLKTAEKVRWTLDVELDKDQFSKQGNQLPPGKIRVRTKKGEDYVRRVDFPYGHHLNPMSMSDEIEKFKDCAAFSPKRIPGSVVEQVIEAVTHLEQVPNVSDIIRLLA